MQLAVLALVLMSLGAVQPRFDVGSAAPTSSDLWFDAPATRPDEGHRLLTDPERADVLRWIDLDVEALVTALFGAAGPRAEASPVEGCRAYAAGDLSARVVEANVDFTGVEAVECPLGEDGTRYREWHGVVHDRRGNVLSTASIGVPIGAGGGLGRAMVTFEHGGRAYEVVPATDGSTYALRGPLSATPEKPPALTVPAAGIADRHDLVGGPIQDGARWEVAADGDEGGLEVPAMPDPDAGLPVSGDPPESPLGYDGDGVPGGQPRAGGRPGNRTIDVLYAYATGITAEQASLYAINRTAQTNTAFITSGMPVRAAAQGPLATGYTQGANLGEDEFSLTFVNGALDGTKSSWEAGDADTLMLFVPESRGACGLGWIASGVDGPGAANPLSVVAVNGCHLAATHELGHNLGSAHNPENDSGDTRVFPWSYGHYVPGVARSVMSYVDACLPGPEDRESDCPRVAQFSDPNDSFTGHPGVASGLAVRDNDRSITDMSWSLSEFGEADSNDHIWFQTAGRGHTSINVEAATGDDPEAPYTPLAGNFAGDGRDEQLWYFPGRPHDPLWSFGGDGGTHLSTSTSVQGSYRPVVGDFDGDGRDDIFWHAPGATSDRIWWGTPTAAEFGNVTSTAIVNGSYSPAAGDLDGDGRDDIFWYAPGSAADSIWWGHPSRDSFRIGVGATAESVNGLYHLVIGDFDGDGPAEALWYQPGTGTDVIWRGRATRDIGAPFQVATTIDGTFTPLVGHLDGDQRADIVWYGPGAATDQAWWGATSLDAFAGQSPSPLAISGWYEPTVGDFNADQIDDLYFFAFG